jgi:hypothetical protein
MHLSVLSLIPLPHSTPLVKLPHSAPSLLCAQTEIELQRERDARAEVLAQMDARKGAAARGESCCGPAFLLHRRAHAHAHAGAHARAHARKGAAARGEACCGPALLPHRRAAPRCAAHTLAHARTRARTHAGGVLRVFTARFHSLCVCTVYPQGVPPHSRWHHLAGRGARALRAQNYSTGAAERAAAQHAPGPHGACDTQPHAHTHTG